QSTGRIFCFENLVQLFEQPFAHGFFLADCFFCGLALSQSLHFCFLLLGQSCSTRCISFRLRLFSSQTVSLSLLTSSQVFFCLCFGCSFRFGRSLGVSFGLCATLFLDASLGCDPFLLLALQGQHPRVFCHLGCATSSGADRSAPLFADVVVFRTRQEVL